MKSLFLLGLLIFAPPSANASSAAFVSASELPDLVEKVLPGVVNISSTVIQTYTQYGMNEFFQFWGLPREHKQTSLGTGFIVDGAKGWVVTNDHVVAHADEVIVTLMDRRQIGARIVGRDPKLDLALLQLQDEKKQVPLGMKALPFGDSDRVRIAEPVFAVGNPFGLQHTVTMGIISAKNRTIGLGPYDNFLQTDASINPGNSGGPLFNLKGEVIGVNTVIFSRTGQSGGVGFAIPSNEAKKVLPDLVLHGRVPRPWLGILAQPLTPPIARALRVKANQGVLVLNQVASSPADRIGLQRGDVILSIDGVKVSEPVELERAIGLKKPKESVLLEVGRQGMKLSRRLTLEELPARIEQLPPGVF